MQRIQNLIDIERHLVQLIEMDRRFEPIKEIAGPLPLRLSSPDFAGLTDIVVSQHISKKSAAAIMLRLVDAVQPLTARMYLATSDKQMVDVGLTRAKHQTLLRVAQAVESGQLDLVAVGELPRDEAIRCLTEFKGIGPWTAEVFLLFCTGHTDVFPAGDVALRTAIGEIFEIDPRPTVDEARKFADQWAPLRGVAARLLWGYYAVRKVDSIKKT